MILRKPRQQQGAIIVKSHTQTDAGRGLWQDKLVWEADVSLQICDITKKLQSAGYKKLGSGADATVWAKDDNYVIKILMPLFEIVLLKNISVL
jgi:hypothetical protein